MAISSDVSFAGVSIPNCYIRCSRPVFTSKTGCRVYVEVYASKDAATSSPGGKKAGDESKSPVKSSVLDFTYDLSDSAANLYSQAYTALKLLPDYTGAKDV